MATSNNTGDTVVRRCANYKPTVWTYEYIQSLTSKYLGEAYAARRDELKEEVKMMLNRAAQPLDQLRLVDVLQRLCLGYHFEDEIRTILSNIHHKDEGGKAEWKEDLFATALRFRLLRQNGYNASIETFNNFKDVDNDKNEICSQFLKEDVDTAMALYEASFLSVESEAILSHARDLAAKHLKEYLEKAKDPDDDVKACLVEHALEIPLHWRMQRVEARWFIDVYERMDGMNPTLLELAKLDYNIVQAIHQEEIKEVSRWWRDSDLANKMSFARDRMMECFLWAMGLRFEPTHKYYRPMMAKLTLLITILDDLYDVHGTVEELELFTRAVESWSIDSADALPDYMKLYFLALYNCVNETVYYTLKEHGLYVMKYARKAWADLCDSYIREAKWFHSGYKSTSLQEYIDNGWRSIALQAPVYEAYFMIKHPLTNDILKCLEEFPSIVVNSSMILRLVDDLGTFKREQEQGDISNAILCYIKETGESKEEAVSHFQSMVEKHWKKMNEDMIGNSSLPHIFIETTMNVSRVGVLEYQRGDGFTVQDQWSKNLTKSLFVDPIPM